MTKIYTVIDSGGQFEDSWRHIAKAFFDEKEACDYMKKENDLLCEQRKEEEAKLKLHEEYEGADYGSLPCINLQLLYDQCDYYIEVIQVY